MVMGRVGSLLGQVPDDVVFFGACELLGQRLASRLLAPHVADAPGSNVEDLAGRPAGGGMTCIR